MDSTIAAALISAIASVVVALIGRASATKHGTAISNSIVPKRHRVFWTACVILLLGWMIFAALFLHWDLAGTSIVLVPIVVVVMSIAFPIQPIMAVSATLILFPPAFAAEPLGKWSRGMHFDNHFELGALAFFVGIAIGTSLIVWLINRWRAHHHFEGESERPAAPTSTTLAQNLSHLSELHRQGALSDEEFARAKEKVISGR